MAKGVIALAIQLIVSNPYRYFYPWVRLGSGSWDCVEARVGSGKFSLKMCSKSGKFAVEIGIQCGKLSLKMLTVRTNYADEQIGSPLSLSCCKLIYFEWMRVENPQ